MTLTKRFRPLFLFAAVALIVNSCVPEATDEVPTGDLTFIALDASGNPVADAKVFLFNFETPYNTYLDDNPEGDPSMEPALSLENVATTNESGEAYFTSRELDGPSRLENEQYVYEPYTIFFRVLAEVDDEFINNDSNDRDVYSLSFPQLDAGEFIQQEVEVILR